MLTDALKQVMKTSKSPGDYIENGVLMCGKCRTPKQMLMSLPVLTGTDTPRPFPVACKCQQEADERAENERRAAEFKNGLEARWRACGAHDRELLKWRFSDDSGGQEKAMDVCRKYCKRWAEVFEENIGVLLFGPVGTGKSFAASCICNELLEQRITVAATSFARVLNTLQNNFSGRQETLDRLGRFQLLFIDDLGAERGSEFSLEQVFAVIDSRYRARKPVVITTNLTLNQLENPENMAYARIFDRILEMCPIRLCMTGDSRRKGNAERRKKVARELLL